MKFKKIMLITFLLLAVLTIGAASAAADVASDDLAVDDDGDSIDSPVNDADLLSDDGDGDDDGDDDDADLLSDDGDGQEEEDEGVIVNITDDQEYNVNEMDTVFARVSVLNTLDGNITIYFDEEDGDFISFFNKNLTDITNKGVDPENESLIIYNITFNDLDNFDDFKKQEWFTISLTTADDDELGACDYEIDYDEDNGIIKFHEIEETEGEGDLIEYAAFFDGNVITNDVIATIPKSNLTQAEDEFDVIIKRYGRESTISLNLSKLDSDEENYLIRVNDLGLEDIGERAQIGLLIQFYDDEGVGICYAEPQNENYEIEIFTNPYISDKANTIEDDYVIAFNEIDGVDDEFTVTISKDGAGDVVKTFKISELDNMAEDDDPAHYELTCSDLEITEGGEYKITVNFTKNGQKYISANSTVEISDELEIWTISDKDEIEDITTTLFGIKVPEEMQGIVKLYVDDVQVGDNKSFDEFSFLPWGDDRGRQVTLNNFNITQSGDYNFKIEVFDVNANLLGTANVTKHYEASENTVEFNDVYYTQDDFFDFKLGTSIGDGYFIVYLNGAKAGKVTIGDEVEIVFDDEFLDIYGEYERFLKVGKYKANITLFDGATETDFANGTFEVKSMNITTDKEVYNKDENVTISFKADQPTEFSELGVYLIKSWAMMGPDPQEIITLKGDKVVAAWKNGAFTLDIGKFDLGENQVFISYSVAETEQDWENDNCIDAADLIIVKVITDPDLSISVANITEGSDAIIQITTNEAFTGDVKVQIGTANYTVAVVNGTGSLPVSGLAAGNYTAYAIFDAAGDFNASVKSTNFTVKAKTATVIKATAVTTTYGTSKNIVVTLTDAAGNALAKHSVVIVLNGVTKTVVTNDKGQATFAIPSNLAAKTYEATITFEGDADCLKSTTTAKVVVNKAKPKLTAKKKTFKAKKKSKKYTIVLKTDKNKALSKVKVTIKVKGKTYKAKTNAKGKATFNLKKLTKKGKYKATVKFAGNKNYKAVTKKVKITVKK